ncbi:Rne/Rng family ribonuclease [Meridianimarinicoccus sp. RP-17]|uniref:Rne/Rng family ribonuclease n=1 Tax=Meridianimarinicoccus zhengii TaxID=2056810 RepID=UPI000DAB64B0|nr:ribonuclease E/G [Phycocomes zhengii]
MAKKMLIDATHAEETRVVVVDGNKVEEFDFESENKRQLAGNIYLAKVTRVEPSLQAAFVDYGGNRHGFLAFSEIHPDYYQIPVADREALLAEELAYDQSQQDDDDPAEPAAPETSADAPAKPRRTRTRRSRGKRGADDAGEGTPPDDASAGPAEAGASDIPAQSIPGMDVVDLGEADAPAEVEDMNSSGLQRVPNGSGAAAAPEVVPSAPAGDTADAGGDDEAAPRDADAPADTAPATDADSPETAGEAATDTDADATEDGSAADTNTDGDDDTPRTPPSTMAARHDGTDAVLHEDVDAATADTAAPAEDDERPSRDDAVQEVEDDAATDRAIESVADDDTAEDIRPPRKPRPRRYKIQEVIKVRQIMLVQVVKEERGNKGAALTTYLSLAGRYCVLMPNTARGGGISRKITNVQDRKKLKEIAAEIDVPRGAGLIIRTAGANRTKAEIRRDYEYLQRLWEQIRDLTLKSVAPAAIYAEGDLIKRTIRDLYNRDIDEVLVEGEAGYRTAKDFMRMIMPSHAKNVKLYSEAQPLFARYQVESYLSEMFNPTVRLKSGGYIVIGVTEALVAIDVNSGKSTKEGSIEETALKTNLEAAEEVARQCRLRDLAGLIVIDFIDMDERRNNAAVEKRLKDKLKTDRARIQMGRISGFGLLEMSRQRLRPGMVEATTKPCPHCHGTGLVRSDDNLALSILRELEEEGVRNRSGEVLVKAPVAIANYLINEKREHIARIEMRYGMAVRVEADPTLISPNFTVEKFKTATRVVRQAHPVISIDMSQMPDDDLLDREAEEAEAAELAEAEAATEVQAPARDRDAESTGKDDSGSDDDGKPRKKRRRRRRRRGGANGEGEASENSGRDRNDDDGYPDADDVRDGRDSTGSDGHAPETAVTDAPAAAAEHTEDVAAPGATATVADDASVDAKVAEPVDAAAPVADDAAAGVTAEAPDHVEVTAPAEQVEATDDSGAVSPAAEATPEPMAEAIPEPVAETTPDPAPESAPEPDAASVAEKAQAGSSMAETVPAEQPEPEPDAVAQPDAPEPDPAADQKPRKRGWWSVGR